MSQNVFTRLEWEWNWIPIAVFGMAFPGGKKRKDVAVFPYNCELVLEVSTAFIHEPSDWVVEFAGKGVSVNIFPCLSGLHVVVVPVGTSIVVFAELDNLVCI